MSESDAEYSPEFIDTLNAWEQHPPLSAEFVFDLPPGDRRKADKVGVLMYQAVLMKQDHPSLDFSRIRAVTFTMDVHRTGDELENVVGHDLPQYRNAAARLDVFHVNLASGQILIITDEVALASLSPQLAMRLGAWEMLRSELARSIAVARLAVRTAARPVAGESALSGRWDSLARYAWTEYFCGYHAAVEGMQTAMARHRLRSALEEDPVALAEAARQFQADGDLDEFVTRAEGCVKGLFEAMAEVLGQLAAEGVPLSEVDPQLESLIRAHALNGLWEALGLRLAALGAHPHEWSAACGPELLVSLGQDFLSGCGLSYATPGRVTCVLPRPDADSSSSGAAPAHRG